MLKWAAAGFLAGALIGVSIPPAPAAIVAAFLLLLAYRVRARGGWQLLLCLAFVLLGSARASHAGPSLGTVGRLNGHRVQLTGVIAEEPDLRDTGANYVVAVTADVVGGHTRPLSGKVQIHTSRAVALEYGDAVEVTGRLAAPRNDALLAYRSILARRGIASTMRFPRILDLGNRSSGPAEWIVLLRQRLEGGIDAWLPQPEAALLIAIALGSRSAALGNVVHPLVSTGLIHIIAVSGIKVAMVAGTGYELLRRLPGRGLRLASGLTLLAAYVLLTGDTVSGERSAVMWGLVFLAAYLGRGTVALLSLTLVAALMVALQPDVVWDPAFQMTALGTGSIVAFSDRLTQALRAIPSPFRESFCVTLAAQAGTLPVVALSFHVVSIWGPVANALVLPFLPLLIALGFALGALSGVVPLAALVAALSYALLHTALTVASALAQLPGAIPVTTVASPFTAVYYVALAWLSVWALRRAQWAPPGRRPATLHDLTFGVAVGAVVLTGTLLPSSIHATQLHWLGTGEALLLQSRGRTVLIDGSPRPFELLEALGSELGLGRTIDAIIVTDPRANVTGLLDVLSHYTVGEVLDVGCEYPTRTYARWRAALRSRRIPVYALRTGVHLSAGNAQIAAIAPDGVYPQPRDSIGLLRLTVPGKRVLLAGAASERELTEAVFRPVSLGADLLVVDAGTPIPAAFLRHVAPARVVRLAIKSRAAMIISPDLARD